MYKLGVLSFLSLLCTSYNGNILCTEYNMMGEKITWSQRRNYIIKKIKASESKKIPTDAS